MGLSWWSDRRRICRSWRLALCTIAITSRVVSLATGERGQIRAFAWIEVLTSHQSSILVGSATDASILEVERSMCFDTSFPNAAELVAIRVRVRATVMETSCLPVSLIHVAIGKLVNPKPMPLTNLPFAYVTLKRRRGCAPLSMAIGLIVSPLPSV